MRAAIVPLACVCVLIAGCGGGDAGVPPGSDASAGRERILFYGCGSCHVIGGIDTADGQVGPPLTDFRSNRFIAGRLPNNPENAVAWIVNPKRFEPETLMPNLGVSEEEARNIVAYLLQQ